MNTEELKKLCEEELLTLRSGILLLAHTGGYSPCGDSEVSKRAQRSIEGSVHRFYETNPFSRSSLDIPETSTSTATGGDTLPSARRAACRRWSSCKAL